MSRDKTSEKVLNELMGLIPDRKVIPVQNITEQDNPRRKLSKTQPVAQRLNDVSKEDLRLYYGNQYEKPGFFYIAHQKKDGIIASISLRKAFTTAPASYQVIYNPDVNDKDLSTHINKRLLRNAAIAANLVQKKKLPFLKIIFSVLAGFSSLVSFISTLLDISKNLDWNLQQGFLAGPFGFWFTVAASTIFAISACSLFSQLQKNRKDILNELQLKLNESSDEEFLEFLASIPGEDLQIPDCKKLKSHRPVFICALQSYNPRQKSILRSYWASLAEKHPWFIFMEDTHKNADIILPATENRIWKFYQMKSLSHHAKKRIARKTYAGQTLVHADGDNGIINYGVDYICRFQLREKAPSEDIDQIQSRIQTFCQKYDSSTTELLIRLVAELSIKYHIDFSASRGWEHLFEYQNENVEIEALDIDLTKQLMLDNNKIFNQIPFISNEFGNCFEEIIVHYQDIKLNSRQIQWCLIKALRCRTNKCEDRYLAISDELMSQWYDPEDVCSLPWIQIMLKTLQVFYTDQIFWFLPSLINKLLQISESSRAAHPSRLFSLPLVSDVARMNLLLSINTAGSNDTPFAIDPVRDHYRVTQKAALEKNPQYPTDCNTDIPDSFGLLQLTTQERQAYYATLAYLGEQAVLRYYGYIFDMYCASLLPLDNHIRYIRYYYDTPYENILYDKYAKAHHLESPTAEDYIKIILDQILVLLEELYNGSFTELEKSVADLRQLMNTECANVRARKIPYVLARFDVMEAATLNFAACMIVRVDDSEKISDDIYLGLGSYLIRIIFLTYHENTLDSFYNNDFIPLLQLCTGYSDPCESILGYLLCCHILYKSKLAKEIIAQYFIEYKEAYQTSLMQIAEGIKEEYLEDFIILLSCISFLAKKEIIPIYEVLRKKLHEKYSSIENIDFFIEYLSLVIDHKSSPQFSSNTPKNNLRKILEFSDDSVYLIYDQYLKYHRDHYLELYPIIAQKSMSASFESSFDSTLVYLKHSTRKHSKEYVRTLKTFLDVIADSKLNHDIDTLDECCKLLETLVQDIVPGNTIYQCIDAEIVRNLILKLTERKEELLVIAAKDYLIPRSWNNYGLLFLLRHLLTDETSKISLPKPEYMLLNEEDKKQYIIKNCMQLNPLIFVGENSIINSTYVDMLTALIHNGDIQKQIDQQKLLLKIAQDTLVIIHHLFSANDSTVAEIRSLVQDYFSMIDR